MLCLCVDCDDVRVSVSISVCAYKCELHVPTPSNIAVFFVCLLVCLFVCLSSLCLLDYPFV